MVVTLNCTVVTTIQSKYDFKLLWVEGDTFLQSDHPHYSIWSTQFDNNTRNFQHHYLTIRRMVTSTSYTCMLLNTSGKVIDTKTHHVLVSEGELFSMGLAT